MPISISNLIMPYFVIAGKRKREPVSNMPGVARLTIDNLLKDAKEAKTLGINSLLLFGVCPALKKDEKATYAYLPEGIIAQAIRALKEKLKGITVITDICLCAYTSHGHCGVIKNGPRSTVHSPLIDNDATLEALAKMALVHAQAGADWVAPSAMAKKQVFAIRKVLDNHGFSKVKILGYSAKFASNFYGPFREAVNSSPSFGDRRSYQLGFSSTKKALDEISEDIREGADMVMVKPALSYLDIIKAVKEKFGFPLAAYNTSGEYALVKIGAAKGLWQEKKVIFEIMSGIKRAGANIIITYHAKEFARWSS